ncbi:hypothetical protein [Neobacillus drentensis]|uniref:hypothetical protein n=1 Tax=Neobacillus drentensis TaxID=220684 RepID=UPI003000B136
MTQPIDKANKRFDDLQLVDANAEFVAARDGETTFGKHLDRFSSDLAEKVTLGHTDHNGATANEPMIEIGVVGAGAAFHLLAGETMTAPYVVGIGVDHDEKQVKPSLLKQKVVQVLG